MQCRAIAGTPEPSRWRKKKAPDHSAFLREVNAATGAGLTGSGSPVRRYVLVVGGDIRRHLRRAPRGPPRSLLVFSFWLLCCVLVGGGGGGAGGGGGRRRGRRPPLKK